MTFIATDVLAEDALGTMLIDLIDQYKPSTLLEIGASDGKGSTKVLAGAKSEKCKLFCIELDHERFELLVENTSSYKNVTAYNVASCGVQGMMSWDRVLQFRRQRPKDLLWRIYTFSQVKEWYDNTFRDIQACEIPEGIQHIKKVNGVKNFDMVFIDGGAFTGLAEMRLCYGAKIIVMDDTMDIKCFDPLMELLSDKNYRLLHRDDHYRNGYAVFEKA